MAAIGTSPGSPYREKNSTADRALEILAMFAPTRLRITAIDVARELRVARSTAYRYLLSLVKAGYLEEDPASGFRLGLKVFELSRLARSSYGLSEIALPELRALATDTGETALLTRRSGDRVVCLEKVESPGDRLRLSYERGSVLALNAGASAWVLLAWEDPAVVERLLETTPLAPLTGEAVVDPAAVRRRLQQIRRDGYSVTRGEVDPDAIGIGVPVRDHDGTVVAGVSVVAVGRRVPPDQESRTVARVRAAAGGISSRLQLVAS